MKRRPATWCLVAAAFAAGCPGSSQLAGDGEDQSDSDVFEEAEAPDDAEATDVGSDETGIEDGRDGLRDEGAGPDFGEWLDLPPVCGDGVIDPGEECDDGNRRNGDSCDWECRLGPGDYEYPLPDGTVPPVVPATSSTPVTEADELHVSTLGEAMGAVCGALHLRAGAGAYALAYNRDYPYFGVALRVIDPTIPSVAAIWTRDFAWEPPRIALTATETEFGLFLSTRYDGLYRTRFGGDGAAREEMLLLRGPHPTAPTGDGPTWDLAGAAWREPIWLVTAGIYLENWWSLEAYGADGFPAGAAVIDMPLHTSNDCVDVVATATGFVVADGEVVVGIGTDLDIAGWSGALRPSGSAGAMDVSPDGVWVAWAEPHGVGWPGRRELWVGGFDFEGNPLFPPRSVYGPYASPWDETGAPTSMRAEMAIARGPAGAAIVFWEGLGEAEPGGQVKILTVDSWGNVITPAESVLEGDASTLFGWALAIDADDGGYGVVTAVPGALLGTVQLVFRRYVAAI